MLSGPDPEVPEKATRRRFTAEYKLRILREADGCVEPGALGALLRREGLYSSHLTTWRRQREQGALEALRPHKRGRPAPPAHPLVRRIAELERDIARLQERLRQAEAIIAAQKKPFRDLGTAGADTRGWRSRLMAAALDLASTVGTVPACAAFGVARVSLYRSRQKMVTPALWARPTPPRALTAVERQALLDVLHSERFVDHAPKAVYATLLDEGTYLGSWRTMYRILASAGEVRERRNQLRHPPYQKPELLATGPNQVWSWDITKLLGPVKWTYFYLYVILDIFSRYAVGWMVAHREGAALAERLITATCDKQAIVAGQLTIHADRGTSMTSKPVALLLADLGVTRTHSRPHVSDDNPYSEAQFKTLKYRPEFPERFGSIEDARAFCHPFFGWYNTEHRHAGIGLLTPEIVHYGRVAPVLDQRRAVLASAYAAHPERFVRKPPEPPAVPTAAWINRPSPAPTSAGARQ
ncbi:MAG: IS3 family transposase [Gemmatimonadota bacterium]